MCGGASLSDVFQRAAGDLRVSVKRRGTESVLDGLRQAGSLKARFPRALAPGWLDVTIVNISGGVAAGDRLETAIAVGAGARVTVAAQGAERYYRALPGSAPSLVRTSIAVAAGGAAEWLPRETILFDRCALDRRLTVDLAPDAWFLGCEMLVFGRAAMGETVETVSLRDLFQVRRDGVALLHDAIRIEGPAAAVLARPAIAAGARAAGVLVHVAPDAEARLDTMRESVPDCAASAWNGMLIARMLAADGAGLLRSMTAGLAVLRDGRKPPRVWMF